MRRGLLLIVLLMSGCASAPAVKAPDAPRWLNLSRLRATDYVCASADAAAPCATVADVRAFLGTARVTP